MFTFDDSPLLYFALGNLLLIFAGSLSLHSFWKPKMSQNNIFVFITIFAFLLVFLILRLPVVVVNQPFNLDESVFIVGAMTLAQDAMYWESVDGCTSGPLNFYIITIFCEVFNQPYDYISARIIGILLILGSIIFYFLALRIFFSTSIAFLSIFPAVAFLSTTRNYDFVHFSSENLPIFLLSLMTYFFAIINAQLFVKNYHVFLFGLVAGAIVFTKLQAIPISAFLTMATYWLIYQKKNGEFKKQTLWLTFGGLLVPFSFFLIAYEYDFVDKIWIFYIQNNLSYGSTKSVIQYIYESLFDKTNIIIRIIALFSLVILYYKLIIKRQFKPDLKSLFIIIFISITLFCVYKTGFLFQHYLLLLVFPTVFLYAFFLNEFLDFSHKKVSMVFLTLILVIVLSKTLIYPFVNDFITADIPQRPLPISSTGKEIIKYSKPNEALVIWGEDGILYLESKRKQGIRWSNSHWGMYTDSLQRLFQQEYVKEFEQKPFPVFVDVHTKKETFMTREKCGYETIPTLKTIIDEKYKFIGEFDEKRIFVRNERFEEVSSK